jgi:hypothetical protein
VAVILSSTSDGASYLRFRDGASNQLTSVTLLGSYATLTTCGASSCTITTKACATCTAASCSNEATSFTDNYPACDCTCNTGYTGAFCDQVLCTNAANCNGRATTVAVTGSSCSCTCSPEWTGASCQTSNVCTMAADCNGRATGVAGNRPLCTCTCQPEWTGPACATSNVCTAAVDCSGHATAVGGNRPSCACTCTAGWAGAACATRLCTVGVDCNATGTSAMTGSYPGCVCQCNRGYGGAMCARLLTASVSKMCSVSASHPLSSSVATSTSDSKSKAQSTSKSGTRSLGSGSASRTTATLSASETADHSKTHSVSHALSATALLSNPTAFLTGSITASSSRSTSISISESGASRPLTRTLNLLTLSRLETLSSWESSAPSGSVSCAAPQNPPLLLLASRAERGCSTLAPFYNLSSQITSCIVGGSEMSTLSALRFPRDAPTHPYFLVIPVATQRQWRYRCPPSINFTTAGGITACYVVADGDVTLLTFYMTTSAAQAVLECGDSALNISWTVEWRPPLSRATEAVATVAAGGGLLSGGGTAAAAMALVSLLSCSGKAPALASLGYVVSVFFDYGFAGMAVGNTGLMAGTFLFQFACVGAWQVVRNVPSTIAASSDLRFPALSLLVAGWLLPGSVYGAVAAIAGGENTAIGAAVLCTACAFIGVSQVILHRSVLPAAVYVPHDPSLRSKGTRFPFLFWLIPSSQWTPPIVVRRFHPLLTSRCRAHCWTAVMDLFLTCLLSVVAALGVGGSVTACRSALVAVAALFFSYGIALAVLRAHRFPMDRLVFPFIQWGFGVLCVLKLTDVGKGVSEAVQLAVSALQLWQVGWSCWVFFVERSLSAAEAALLAHGGQEDVDRELSVRKGPAGPHCSVAGTFSLLDLGVPLELGAPLISLLPPLRDEFVDESKFWDADGFAMHSGCASPDSPLFIQPCLAVASSSILDDILESIDGYSFGRNESMYSSPS